MGDVLDKMMQDKVSGFVGKCIGYARYSSGQESVLLQPKCTAQGEFKEAQWLDYSRCEFV